MEPLPSSATSPTQAAETSSREALHGIFVATGMQKAKGGVVAMLEASWHPSSFCGSGDPASGRLQHTSRILSVLACPQVIESDFSRMEAEATASEAGQPLFSYLGGHKLQRTHTNEDGTGSQV